VPRDTPRLFASSHRSGGSSPRKVPMHFALSCSTRKSAQRRFFYHATRQGLEPQLTVPETVVLPLDDRVIILLLCFANRLMGGRGSYCRARRGSRECWHSHDRVCADRKLCFPLDDRVLCLLYSPASQPLAQSRPAILPQLPKDSSVSVHRQRYLSIFQPHTFSLVGLYSRWIIAVLRSFKIREKLCIACIRFILVSRQRCSMKILVKTE
jgi:hypothetical protein